MSIIKITDTDLANLYAKYQSQVLDNELNTFISSLAGFYMTMDNTYKFQMGHTGYENFSKTIHDYLASNNYAKFREMKELFKISQQ